jgi:hypothetical protein
LAGRPDWRGPASTPALQEARILWNLLDQLDPEDGLLWVYDINDDEAVPAFTSFGIENLREIIKDQMDKAG